MHKMTNTQNNNFLLVFIYLLAISSVSNAKKDDDWTAWDIIKYGGMTIAGGAGAVVAAPVVLAAAGFTGAGIAAGSLAAVAQAGIGNVIGGTTFAALQSAGVAGLGGVASASLATVGAAIGAVFARTTDKKQDREED